MNRGHQLYVVTLVLIALVFFGQGTAAIAVQCVNHTCGCILTDYGISYQGGTCLSSATYSMLSVTNGCCNTLGGCPTTSSCSFSMNITPTCSEDPCQIKVDVGGSNVCYTGAREFRIIR